MAKKLKVLKTKKSKKAMGFNIPRPGKDYKLNLPKPHLSFSQISSYLTCPAAYYRSYVLNAPREYSVHLAEGATMDAALEQAINYRMKNDKHMSLKRVQDLFAKEWKKAAPLVTRWYDVKRDEVRQRGRVFLQRMWSKGPDINPVINGQARVEIELAGVPILGFIDLVEAATVIDFKVAGDARRYNPYKSLQLALYAVDRQIDHVAFWVFEKSTLALKWKDAHLDLEATKRWLEYTISQVAKAISEEVFPPCMVDKNPFCSSKWCDHWDVCRGSCE